MKSVIRTNKVIPHINHAMIDERYDIFCLETSQKYIKSGARIIDAPLLNKGVKAVLFENGRRFYVLLEHSADNLSVMKKVLLGSLMFLAGLLSSAILIAGSIAHNDWINAELSVMDEISLYGLMPVLYTFIIITVIGIVIAGWGLLDKK